MAYPAKYDRIRIVLAKYRVFFSPNVMCDGGELVLKLYLPLIRRALGISSTQNLRFRRLCCCRR